MTDDSGVLKNQVYSTSLPGTINTSSSQLYISFLNYASTIGTPIEDTGYSPNSASIAITAPTSVATLSNGNTALYWTTVPLDFGLVPNKALGSSTITQTTSDAVGTIVGYLSGLVSGGIGLELSNVTGGVFVASDALTLDLDETQDIFTLLTHPINYIATPYDINAGNLLTNSSYAPFTSFLVYGNASTSVNNQQYYALGFVANTSIPQGSLSTLPPFDPSSYGARNIVGGYAPSFPALGDVTLSSAEVAAYHCGLMAFNDIPFNPINKINTPLPISSNVGSLLKSTQAGAVLNLGWTPFVYEPTSKQLQIVRNVTGLLYIPSTMVPDTENFPVTNQQIIGLWKQSVYEFLSQSQFTNVRKSSVVKGQALRGIQGISTQFEQTGMFTDTAVYNKQFTITDDITDPSAYDVYTPIVIEPELNAFNVTANVQSYLISITTQA